MRSAALTRFDLERRHDARGHAKEALIRLLKVRDGGTAVGAHVFPAFLFDLVVVGTTMGKTSKAVQALGPEIPWRDVTDTRNRAVHACWQADFEILDTVTAERLQRLVSALDGVVGFVES